MPKSLRRSLGLALGALATTSLGGCYYGDVNGAYGGGYAGNDCVSRYGDTYYDYDPYAYDDGYGYDCYDGSDYGGGFVNIGFGGGWYDNYYYPGYGLWLFDSYNNRYPLRGQYLNYWGGRRAWWKYHGRRGDGHWNGNGRPGRGDGPRGDGRPGRPGGWDGRDRDNDGPRGTPPPGTGNGYPPTAGNPGRPGRPDRGPGTGRPRPPQDSTGATRPRPQWRGISENEPGELISKPPTRATGTRPLPRPRGTPSTGAATPRGDRTPGSYRPSRGPLPTSRVAPAPAARAAPPVRNASPPVTRSAPSRPAPAARAPSPRPAPTARTSRADRSSHVRED